MLQKLGYVEMGSLAGGERCLASMLRTRYRGRHQRQDGLECKELELSPMKRMNVALTACAGVEGQGLAHGWSLVLEQHLLHVPLLQV